MRLNAVAYRDNRVEVVIFNFADTSRVLRFEPSNFLYSIFLQLTFLINIY